MDQHRFDWCGQPSFMNRYDTQQLLGYSSLSLSQALSALQTPDFAANSCGIQAFGLREYVRLHNLVQDEKLTFKKFDLVLRHILLNFHVTVGEQSLDLQPFAHGMTNEEGLYRSYTAGEASIDAYLEDYAYVIDALSALYQVTFNEKWLTKAKSLTKYTLDHFYDQEEGLFFFTDNSSERLITRKKEVFDNVRRGRCV